MCPCVVHSLKTWRVCVYIFYLQAGEEISQLHEERQQDESDEACLRWRFGHFIPVHEGGDGETLQLLHITLRTEKEKLFMSSGF